MAFATVAGTATTSVNATTTPVVDLPASIVAGETILGLYRSAGAGAITFPDGTWVALFNGDLDGSDDNIALHWRKATGTEGATITLGSGNQKGAWLCYRISNAADPTVSAPEANTNTGSSALPTSNALSPTGGAKDYLWLALATSAGSPTISAYPTSYGSNQLYVAAPAGGATGTRCMVAGATRELNIASENPGDYTISAAFNWLASTVAVHPVPAAPAGFPFRRKDRLFIPTYL